MKLTVNGDERKFDQCTMSVEELLDKLDIEAKYLAVQVNDEVVKRGTFAEIVLRDGDTVQIVQFMGGGD
jgi:thiamine biosynthesis protein ThiS